MAWGTWVSFSKLRNGAFWRKTVLCLGDQGGNTEGPGYNFNIEWIEWELGPNGHVTHGSREKVMNWLFVMDDKKDVQVSKITLVSKE